LRQRDPFGADCCFPKKRQRPEAVTDTRWSSRAGGWSAVVRRLRSCPCISVLLHEFHAHRSCWLRAPSAGSSAGDGGGWLCGCPRLRRVPSAQPSMRFG
jgi:hypothetical protein